MNKFQLNQAAAHITYSVSTEQLAQLLADNLDVPVDCVSVTFNLAATGRDGVTQYVDSISVDVDNELISRIKSRADELPSLI